MLHDPQRGARRWLLMVHQLPSEPSNVRVRTWRQLRHLGAVSIKQAVYVLPDSSAAREGFQRLRAQIASLGGEASVFSAASVDAWSDDALVEAFRQSRERDYGAMAEDLERTLRLRGRRKHASAPAPQRLEQFRQRLGVAERLDFFAAPGRDRVVALLARLAAAACPDDSAIARHGSRSQRRDEYGGRLWVTRPRPGVDRIASAWLIRRFIDPDARFDFVIDRQAAPRDALPFDMSEVEFSHHDDSCTFETLCERFGIEDAGVRRIAAIVHDLDLRDEKFRSPDTPTVGDIIQGLQRANSEDDVLLDRGMALFEALYRRKP